ncbi:Dolichyl-phosphate-mannose-protein mannosyltransferase [Micromonospora auratinigra]|uniref:Dolichyl-phosphate-mannose-protein mannosyltransferase n=2 Tax=Micromonospora auratinigra TaxID=261654 RepID=A0A1A8Z0R1_9ACTN|nr:Dolichyl-phosphate-mannose-protein mannosyltransferase [Micromonospora auratinigra]
MTVAYPPALWFSGDSGVYVRHAQIWPALSTRGLYPWLIKAFEWTGSFTSLVAVQHLAGLALGVAIYLLVRRRLGGSDWVATLAAAPVVLDARQLTLEQYLLTETLFTAALAGAALVLAWKERPGPVAGFVAGLAVAVGVLTRPTGVVAVGVLLLLLLLPWRGWRAPVAYLLGILALWGAVLVTVGSAPNAYGVGGGRFLYGRTAQIADCDRLDLSPDLRRLCPRQPVDQRPERPDWFIWNKDSPIVDAKRPEDLDAFARAVIRQQTGDYLARVAADTSRYFWAQRLGPKETCLAQWWVPPLAPADWAADRDCTPRLADPHYDSQPAPSQASPPNAAAEFLHGYGRYGTTPPLAVTAMTLLALTGALWPRRGRLRLSLLALGFAAIGMGIMIFSVATSMFDYRYGLPALAFLPIAAAAGWQRLRATPTDRPAPAVDDDEPQPAPLAPTLTGSNGER